VTGLEFNLAALVLHRLTILIAGVSLAYLGFRLFLSGDPKLKNAAWAFAVAGAIALAVGCAWKPAALDVSKATASTAVTAVPDSIWKIVVRSLCRAQASDERRRFLSWYAAEQRVCP
jgi:hypothetical protein